MPTTNASHFDCTFPDGPASSIVGVGDRRPHDNGSDSITVAVATSRRRVFSRRHFADEGETKTYTYTITDPGQDTVRRRDELRCERHQRCDTAAANYSTCTFPDGPASSIVKVTADDGDASQQHRLGLEVRDREQRPAELDHHGSGVRSDLPGEQRHRDLQGFVY